MKLQVRTTPAGRGCILALVALGLPFVGCVWWQSGYEDRLIAMVDRGDLVGLTTMEAGRKLGWSLPKTQEGQLYFDSEDVNAWTKIVIIMEVKDGRIAAARLGP